jgi:hypothetical protein
VHAAKKPAAEASPAKPGKPAHPNTRAAHTRALFLIKGKSKDRAQTAAEDAAAFDAMCAARPTKPPPMPAQPDLRRSGALALERDRAKGLISGDRLFRNGPGGSPFRADHSEGWALRGRS